MTTYTWKIQYTDFYSDQFKDNGVVEKENAVTEFQLFPWDKQIDDYRRKTDNSCIPTIVFSSSDQRQLIIDAINLKGFNLKYFNLTTNQHSDFYISNDIEKSNWTTEEIIEFFFDNSLEQHITLNPILPPLPIKPNEEKEKKASKNIEFDFMPNHFKVIGLFTFLFTLFWLGLFITMLVFDKIYGNKLPVLFHVVLCLPWLPTFILHFTYFFKNKSCKVIVDTKNHNLTYIKGFKEIKFNRDDIFRCQITTTISGRPIWDNYSYVWFILNNGSYVIITCFVENHLKIVDSLNCKFEVVPRTIPFLPL